MGQPAAMRIVTAFVRAICDNDVAAMAALMSDDHRFIDSREHAVEGRAAATATWEEFFRRQPGYRIHIESSFVRHGEVHLSGRSEGTHPGLRGHALWRARLRGGRIAEWQVYREMGVSKSDLGLIDQQMIAALEPLLRTG